VFDHLPFQRVSGPKTERHIQLLALSTCGFCRRGQEFLERHQFAYEYIHLDTLDAEVKAQVKVQFKETFGTGLSYPALILDDTEHTIGYVKRFWEELLKLPHEDEESQT